MAHPFGEEELASLKSLCEVFCRCLLRGHWELARACLSALHRSHKADDIERLVTGLVAAPHVVQSTEHTSEQVAWFWFNVLETWFVKESQVLSNLKNETAFLLLLQEFQNQVPQQTLKDLYELYSSSRYDVKTNRRDVSTLCLTSDTVSLLRENLCQNPELLQTLLSFLLVDDNHSTASEYNHRLLNITVDFFLDLLTSLHEHNQTDSPSDDLFSQPVNQIYKVLSTMCFDLDLQASELSELCAKVFRASWVDGYVLEEQVQASMLRKKNSGLVSLYGNVINEKVKTCFAAQISSERVFAQELTDNEKTIINFFCNTQHSDPWKMVFFYSLSTGKHFLEQILLTALTVLKAEDFCTLGDLLSNEFTPLRRLLVLLGWTHLHSIETAKSLLHRLHNDTEICNDSILKEFCDGLLFQVEVVEWCIEQKSHCVAKKDILQYLNSLDSHSGLYILHNLTYLPKLNEDDVFRLFHKGLSSGKNEVTANQRESHDLAQRRSSVLFQAFCALKYAVYALCIHANKHAKFKNSHERQMDGSLEDAGFKKEPEGESGFSQVADPSDLFVQYFTKCQHYLSLLPPQLKLELVENMFSLLFASLNDLALDTQLSDECHMEEVKEDLGMNVGRPGSSDTSIDRERLVKSSFSSPQHTSSNLNNGNITDSSYQTSLDNARANYIDLEHFILGLTGFLADEIVLDTFLKMLREQVEQIKESIQLDSVSLNDELNLLKGVSTPSSSKEFSNRVAQLSEYISEAQWRYKMVMSNKNAESNSSNLSVRSDVDCHCVLQQRGNLVPMMLSPPESLLISCILRKNYSEAHQVAQMFHLQSHPCYGELTFMERYQEVIGELAKVEKKIENQSSETTIRKTNNSRSTLQAIGNAAAAGMVFYSISDVTDKLVALAESSVPTLQDDFWIRNDTWKNIVEELSPAAMAAFDLACTQSHLWKTCKQLLETSERRLLTRLESKGRRADMIMEHCEGIKGFQVVLQQMNKLINYPSVLQAQNETEEKLSNLFKCSITEIFHTCYSLLQDDYLVSHIILDYELEQILLQLKSAIDCHEQKSNIVQSLLDQLTTKPQVLMNPVRKQMSLLLENLEKRTQTLNVESYIFDHVYRFFVYIDTLAKVIVQSINSDLDSSLDLKVGNPFILLRQKPSQLISFLVFERQVSPDRLSSLLKKEMLQLDVGQVIVDSCCEALSFSHPKKLNEEQLLAYNLQQLMQQSLEIGFPDIHIKVSTCTKDSEDDMQCKPILQASDCCQYFLTSSALNFLKSKSNVTAVLTCLSVIKSQKPPKSGLSWMDLRGSRKESPLDMDTISSECDGMLCEFPVFQRYIHLMSAPFREDLQDTSSPSGALCGKPCSALVLLGLHASSSGAVSEAFKEALSKKDWTNALQIINHYTCNVDGLEEVRDALLCCAAAEEMNGWRYLFAVNNASLRVRLALNFLDKWPLDSCRELLTYCLCETDIEENLKVELKNKRKEVEVYRKILFLKEDIAQSSRQDLKEDCIKDPEAIIQLILKTKDYKLCEDWGLFYPIPNDLSIDVYLDHLLHLLDNKDTERSLQLLKRVDDKNKQLAVIERALQQDPCIYSIHFLSEYMVLHFKNNLQEIHWREIRNLYMGSKVLLALPEAAQSTYEHLISSPLLMLEQLLMNMKIDWISTAVQTLKQLVNDPDSTFSTEDMDKLLCIYAGKALDVPFSFREKRTDSVNRIPESSSQSAELETVNSSSQADQLPSTPFVGTPDKSQRRNKPSPEFIPPEKPPSKMQWIPDDTEVICMVCKNERFTMFNRRHHCRRCGRLVCSSCSMKKMVVEGCRENPARVCDQCHDYFSTNDTKTEEDLENMKEKQGEGRDLSEVLRLSKAAELQWCLTLNEAENEVERREFYYEQAPSASLCSAILSLHSKSDECGYQLIERCCLLSKELTNPEMDSRLLLDIMKNLLFSAKMFFVKAARSHDLALCDSYSSKVDLLKILVAASYKDIPSLHEIVRPAAVVRLRNQLLEAEYYSLATEVSTKTGLDTSGMWHAWGMACLKSDNLPGAREKFSRCIKAPLDLNQKNVGSKFLEDIIQYLESTAKPILLVKDDDYFATLKELEFTLKARCLWYEMMPEGKIQNNMYYRECLYYLHTYGTNLGIIQFYMRHDLMKDALVHLLNKECPGDIFIEGIFVPSYENGKLHVLENMLETIDSSLESWSAYLIEACRHLQKKNFYNILYEIQQFMKDHVRAAMTCIRFFSHKANTYHDLGGNQKWLVKSKDHLKTYLQEISRSNRRKSFDTFRKKMSAADVSRHINTIELQMEITKFLQRCENLETSQDHNKQPPTLFGHNNMKIDVACRVILGGKNVEEGFGIAFRVIQDFQLDPSMVYSKVCKQLVRQQNYSEILQLVKCVSESGIAAEKDCDQILLRCVEEMSDFSSDELEKLIQGMKSDEAKVKAFLACRMMRSAYLTAVKLEQEKAIRLVQEVWQVAHKFNDNIIQGICSKWLDEHTPHSKEGQHHTSRK